MIEQSARERRLARQMAQQARSFEQQKREYQQVIEKLRTALDDLQQQLQEVRSAMETRERTIERLEHECEILKYDIRGMAIVNARALKWIESFRIAEEKPLTEQNLSRQLEDLQGTVPWPTT